MTIYTNSGVEDDSLDALMGIVENLHEALATAINRERAGIALTEKNKARIALVQGLHHHLEGEKRLSTGAQLQAAEQLMNALCQSYNLKDRERNFASISARTHSLLNEMGKTANRAALDVQTRAGDYVTAIRAAHEAFEALEQAHHADVTTERETSSELAAQLYEQLNVTLGYVVAQQSTAAGAGYTSMLNQLMNAVRENNSRVRAHMAYLKKLREGTLEAGEQDPDLLDENDGNEGNSGESGNDGNSSNDNNDSNSGNDGDGGTPTDPSTMGDEVIDAA